MFSTGQLIFAAFFLLAFIAVVIFAYGRDRNLHRRHYKGVRWIAIFFVTFVIILFIIKYLLKK